MSERQLWERYKKYLCVCEPIGLTLDVSRMNFDEAFLSRMQAPLASAFDAMEALEKGAIANPDEKRKVGHYWLRAPELAPEPALTRAIQDTVAQVRAFAADVHAGRVKPPGAARFTQVLVIGIGGSALGPQLVADALGSARAPMSLHFFDNTDPDGFDRTLSQLGERLSETLVGVLVGLFDEAVLVLFGALHFVEGVGHLARRRGILDRNGIDRNTRVKGIHRRLDRRLDSLGNRLDRRSGIV